MFTPAVRNITNSRAFLTGKPLNFVRFSSSKSERGSAGKKVFLATNAILLGGTGALVYGVHNKEFRDKVELSMPWTKCLFDTTQNLLSPKPKPQKMIRINRDDVDPDYVKQKNEELERALKSSIKIAEGLVRTSKYSKLNTITMTREHAALLKKAVDDGKHGNWVAVSTALEKADTFAHIDRNDEVKARNALDNLKQISLNGKECAYTFDNQLIVLAMETVSKLEQQVNEFNLLAEAARARGLLITQYSVLVQQSRNQLNTQLNYCTHNKENKPNPEHSEEILSKARCEVDALHKQLEQQQQEAESRIADAIQAQHVCSSHIAKQELDTERDRVKLSVQDHSHPEISTGREEWELQLKDRLARAELAHDQHMQQVLQMQNQIHQAQMNDKVEEEVNRERRRHARQINRSQSKLDAMQTALFKRSHMDNINRRMKYCWLACQSLVDSVNNGNYKEDNAISRRKPLANQLSQIREAGNKDAFIDSLVSLMPNVSIYQGTFTQNDLRQRFTKVEKTARNVAYVDDNDTGPFNYALSYARSKLRIPSLYNKTSSRDRIDPMQITNVQVLDRARRLMDENDMDSTVRTMQLLDGQARRVAKDWILESRTLLETRMLAHALVAHSAINGIRTTY